MPTMPTPVSPPAPHSAMDSSSASCWSNPWTVPSSIQEEVHRLKPVAALSSSSKAAATAALPPKAAGIALDAPQNSALDGDHPLLQAVGTPRFGRGEAARPHVRPAGERKRHTASRSLSSYRHCRSSSSLVEEMAAFSSSALTS
ncbi:hypothetical protein OsJ_23137 [Oryza sativa Japonica Group]|uniref:Uncharacterized protein n=1 Tax=Oryza sativa subsp. japonica TaxID=39947 RepID=B9FVK0_ORYSJ|nr:hypothetical protein OsJ_23137 [Oryza sativa Japonica Group]